MGLTFSPGRLIIDEKKQKPENGRSTGGTFPYSEPRQVGARREKPLGMDPGGRAGTGETPSMADVVPR